MPHMTLRERLDHLPAEAWAGHGLFFRPIGTDEDLWYAVVECQLKPGQEDLVNPAGFSIGRAYLAPDHHIPCVICKADGARMGYIVLRSWHDRSLGAASWSYYLDAGSQGQGWGKKAARLAVDLLRAAGVERLRLSTEVSNTKAQRLYESIGFARLEELDGSDLIYGM